MTELESFELFRPEGKRKYFISARNKSVGISKDAYEDLGQPEYVLVYIDEVKKRIMIQAVDKKYDNAIKVVKHSAGGGKRSRNMCLCCRALTKAMTEMYNQSIRVHGHMAGENMMIFDKVDESWQKMN